MKYIKYLIIMFLVSVVCGCGAKFYMNPNIAKVKQDYYGIYICRYDFEGGVICERNLDYFLQKNSKRDLYLIPEEGFE